MKNFLYFSSAEKIAVLILIMIVVLFFGFNVFLSRRSNVAVSIPQNDSLIAAFDRLQESLESKKKESRGYDYKSRVRSERSDNQKNSHKSKDPTQTKYYSEQPSYTKQEKFSEPNAISLNEVDTAQWKMVPGIGSAYSERIVKYGDKLGGYISIIQLKEVYGVTDEVFDAIAPFIREDNIGPEQCAKLNINKLEFKELLSHPYINFEQTKAIVNLRKRTGNITSTSQLAMLDEFTPEDIKRITPYIDF